MDQDQHFKHIDAYLAGATLPPNPILQAIADASDAAGLVPHAVSPLQAGLLALFVRLMGAQRILEIGCLGGYSAVAMAQALPPTGSVLTTEIDTRTAQVALENIRAAGYADQIDLRVGPALTVLEEQIALKARFDLIFIDADKVNHRTYVEKALSLSLPGTLIIADNVVRGGAVLEEHATENSVRGVRELMTFVTGLEGVTMTALQTVGEKGHDGMLLLRVETA